VVRSLAEHYAIPLDFNENEALSWVRDAVAQFRGTATIGILTAEGQGDLIMPDVRHRNAFLDRVAEVDFDGGDAAVHSNWGSWALTAVIDQLRFLSDELEKYLVAGVVDLTPRGNNFGGLILALIQKYVIRARVPWRELIIKAPVSCPAADVAQLDRVLRDFLDYFWGRMKLVAARNLAALDAAKVIPAGGGGVLALGAAPPQPAAAAPAGTLNEVARRTAGAMARYVETVIERGAGGEE
jgi:hypothetical protein